MRECKNHARNVEISDIDGIMSTNAGRNFLARILHMTGLWSSTSNTDVNEMIRASAKRDVGLWIESELKEACSEKYFLMLKERELENGR